MDKGELLSNIANRPRTPEVAVAKKEMVDVYRTPPSHIDAYMELVNSREVKLELRGVCLAFAGDFLEKVTHFSQRKAAYRLNRELGFSRFDSLAHASAATGLAVASMVEMTTQPERS